MNACPFELRRNFNTFWNSLTSMFLVFTAEGWTDLMTDGMRLQSAGPLGIYAAIFFFLGSYLFFHHVMANLFIAVILDNFSTSEVSGCLCVCYQNPRYASMPVRKGII